MNSNEMLFQIRRLRKYIGEVREHQEHCTHNHHCHWHDKLSKAEGLAYEIQREYETQEGERLLKQERCA